ncbi:hypothetical protein LCGC14_1448350 [marine sediment metagenome]|uniref:Uncharacterized protein n=1 Tax=marine sediment metagenome TaxID=412755 RepID=A0A0F9JIH9_9ZZZZ
MIVRVKKIFYEDTVWTTVILKSGKKIEFFDENCRDLSEYINKDIDLLIIVSFFSILDCDKKLIPPGVSGQGKHYKIKGKYLGEYIIPSHYFRIEDNLKNGLRGFHGIKIEDGIFLISPTAIKTDLSVNEDVCLEISRFDLFGGIF